MDADITYGYTAQDLADVTGVHVATARRWKRGEPVPEPALRLLRLVLAGDLGALSQVWRGWCLNGRAGTLVSPEQMTFSPGEVLVLPFMRAQVAAYQARQRFAPQADWIDGRYVSPDESAAPTGALTGALPA